MSFEPKRYKIIGNFGPAGTKVVDQQTGQELAQVKAVYWCHEAGSVPKCFLELVGVELESDAAYEFVDATDMQSGFWRKFLPRKKAE
jgi:hypothetical protein